MERNQKDPLEALLAFAETEFDKPPENQEVSPKCNKEAQKIEDNIKTDKIKRKNLTEFDLFGPKDDDQPSLLHDGDTDSSDDETNRNFEEQKYNECGKQIKQLLLTVDQNQISTSHYGQPKKRVSTWKDKPLEESGKHNTPFSNHKPQLRSLKPHDFGNSSSNPAQSKPLDVLIDPFFGIRIIKPLISHSTIVERMQGREAVQLSTIQRFLMRNVYKEKDWVICGVVVGKSPVKTSQKGSQYSIWTLSDLKNDIKTVAMFMFSGAHKALWKTSVGTVIGVLNPGVMDRRDNSKDEATLSIDNAQKVMIFGQSKDYGLCKSTKKNGDKCNAIINLSICEFCIYHIKQEYQKCSKRSELQANFAGQGLTALRNKVLGKNEVFYAGKSYMAVPAKKSRKMAAKDESIINKLNGINVNSNPIIKAKNANTKKRGAARQLDISPAQRLRDIELLKKLGGGIESKTNFSGTHSSEVSLESAKSTASSVINKLKTKKNYIEIPKSSQFNINTDLLVEGKNNFFGKISEDVTLEEAKSTAVSVISRLKAKNTSNESEGKENVLTEEEEEQNIEEMLASFECDEFNYDDEDNIKTDLPVEGKTNFAGKISEDVTLKDAKSTAVSVISRLKAINAFKNQDIESTETENAPTEEEQQNIEEMLAAFECDEFNYDDDDDVDNVIMRKNCDKNIQKNKESNSKPISESNSKDRTTEKGEDEKKSNEKEKANMDSLNYNSKSILDKTLNDCSPKSSTKDLRAVLKSSPSSRPKSSSNSAQNNLLSSSFENSSGTLNSNLCSTPKSGTPKTSNISTPKSTTTFKSNIGSALKSDLSVLNNSTPKSKNAGSVSKSGTGSTPTTSLNKCDSKDSTHKNSFSNNSPKITPNLINRQQSPALKNTNHTVGPTLSGFSKNDMVDLSAPVTRHHVNRAKLNAISFIKKHGPIKKVDPNSTKSSGKKRPMGEILNGEASNPVKKSKLQENEFISDRWKKMMAATSKHQDLIEQHYDEEKEKYFKKLEVKEKMEEKMTSTYKVACKAVRCLKCKYTSFSASDLCKSERHPLRVCKTFNETGSKLLSRGFYLLERRHNTIYKRVKSALPRRESERKTHPLARHCDILQGVETRISMLNMTYSRYIDNKVVCFIPGKVLDEMQSVLNLVQSNRQPPRTHQLLQELRDLSSMAMEHFDEFIVPGVKEKLEERNGSPEKILKELEVVAGSLGRPYTSIQADLLAMMEEDIQLTLLPNSGAGSPNKLSKELQGLLSSPNIRKQDIITKNISPSSSRCARLLLPQAQQMPHAITNEILKIKRATKIHKGHITHLTHSSRRISLKLRRQSNLLREQHLRLKKQEMRIQHQSSKLREQESTIAEIKRHIEEWEQKYNDLTTELVRARDEILRKAATTPQTPSVLHSPPILPVVTPPCYKSNIKPRTSQVGLPKTHLQFDFERKRKPISRLSPEVPVKRQRSPKEGTSMGTDANFEIKIPDLANFEKTTNDKQDCDNLPKVILNIDKGGQNPGESKILLSQIDHLLSGKIAENVKARKRKMAEDIDLK